MATTYKIVYKNHCTPQEQISSGGRYYLDSDCGRKLTGTAETSATVSGSFGYDLSFDVTSTASSALTSSHVFIFVKNTGSTDVLLTLDDSNYLIKLSEGQSFASEINSSAVVKVKTASGTSTVEYLAGR
jgi:hypothetical protein